MGSAKWWGVTNWYIDPAGTNPTVGGSIGNDEADGLTNKTPLKSMAEWRRRINGAVFTGNGPVIQALSGSTVTDDGLFYGYTTPDLTTYVRVIGTPVVTGLSGTVSSYQPYSGNTRGQFADTAIPVSWTASGGISGASGSRFARVVGTGVRHYAPLLTDMASKTVQFGIVVDWDETDAVTLKTVETNFANADAYEVVSMPTWPSARAISGNVQLQCFDILGSVAPTFRKSHSFSGLLRYRICGFPQNTILGSSNAAAFYSCAICMPSPVGLTITGSNVTFTNCSLSNSAIFELGGGPSTWTGTTNVVANAELRFWHGSMVGALGALRMFDCTTALVSIRHMSLARLAGSIVGSGNSGALVNCDTGGLFYGASLITATTSAAHPYTISGVNHDTAAVETSGDAVYA
jgi:hypothetical protein